MATPSYPSSCRRYVADRIERVVVRCGLCISTVFIYISAAFIGISTAFGRWVVLIGRDDGQPQTLTDRRQVIRKARPPVENDAERRVTGVSAQDAARRASRRQTVQRPGVAFRTESGKTDHAVEG